MVLVKQINNDYKLITKDNFEFDYLSLKELIHIIVKVFNMKVSTIEEALVDMEVNCNNIAYFGDVNDSFLYSSKFHDNMH